MVFTHDGIWPFIFILIAGAFATHIWRWLGVAFAGRVREESELFVWVKAVATALIAGVIANLILDPAGVLAETALWTRIAAAAFGFAIYWVFSKNVLAGVVAAEAAIVVALILR